MIPFHPCGTVMDLIRSAYVCKMRLWADSDEETEVRWFFAEPGAKVMDVPHPFGSWYTWDRKDGVEPGPLGEQRYVRYDRGANDLGYGGSHYCGSDAAVRGGGVHGVDPVIATDADGGAGCCVEFLDLECRKYPKRLTLAAASTFGFCPCHGLDEFALTYIGYEELAEADGNPGPRWAYRDGESPWRRFGGCSWDRGAGPQEGWARWDVIVPQFGLSHCEAFLRLRLAVKTGPDTFDQFRDDLFDLAVTLDNPWTLVKGLAWPDAGTPGCGRRFGVGPSAELLVTVTGQAIPA